jgi:hypothetical protein
MPNPSTRRIHFEWQLSEDCLERDVIEAIRHDPHQTQRSVMVTSAMMIHACDPLYRRMLRGDMSEAEARILAVKYSTQLRAIADQYEQLFGLMPGRMLSSPAPSAEQANGKVTAQSSSAPVQPTALPPGMLYADELMGNWMTEDD